MNPLQAWYNNTVDMPRQKAILSDPPRQPDPEIAPARILIEISEPRFCHVSPAGNLHAHALLYCTYVHTAIAARFPDAAIHVNTTLNKTHRIVIDAKDMADGEVIQEFILATLDRVFRSGSWYV